MSNQLLLYNIKTNQGYDITNLVGEKKWSGSTSQAARTLDFSFIMGKGADINIGDVIFFKMDGKEVYRGMVLTRGREQRGVRPIKTVDFMYYWTKNKDTFTFSSKKASDIFKEVANRFQIDIGKVDDTQYVIGDQVNPNHSLYDVMKMALETTYQQTGMRYNLRQVEGKACLLSLKNQTHAWVLESEKSIIDYDYEETMGNMYTAIKLVSQDEKDTWSVEVKNDSLISNYGFLQYFETLDNKTNQSQARVMANNLLKEKGKIQNTLSLTSIGLSDVLSGDAIFIRIPELEITKTFYVTSDTHSIKGNLHTMKLNLTETNDFEIK